MNSAGHSAGHWQSQEITGNTVVVFTAATSSHDDDYTSYRC